MYKVLEEVRRTQPTMLEKTLMAQVASIQMSITTATKQQMIKFNDHVVSPEHFDANVRAVRAEIIQGLDEFFIKGIVAHSPTPLPSMGLSMARVGEDSIEVLDRIITAIADDPTSDFIVCHPSVVSIIHSLLPDMFEEAQPDAFKGSTNTMLIGYLQVSDVQTVAVYSYLDDYVIVGNSCKIALNVGDLYDDKCYAHVEFGGIESVQVLEFATTD